MGAENTRTHNFITQIIDEDLASGKHKSVPIPFSARARWLFAYWSRKVYLLEFWLGKRISKVYATYVLTIPIL